MPPNLSVSTYIPCSDDSRQAILARFVELLQRFGYRGGDVEAWLADIHWPPQGDDLGGGLHPDAPLLAVEVAGQALRVLPIVTVWASETIPGLPAPHLQLELAFDTHAERPYDWAEDTAISVRGPSAYTGEDGGAGR